MRPARRLLVLLPRRFKLMHLVGLFTVVILFFFVSAPAHRDNFLYGREDQQIAQPSGNTVNGPMSLLLHLDLKGAPPKLAYFEEFLPFARSLGVDGLLIEYEDTFPFHGRLSVLRSSSFFYTKEDIQRLLQLAASLGMQVIPLVQTFGHMEFVLKHDTFKGLREQPFIDWSLCPLHDGSMALIAEMIDQVMTLHPNVKHIHIGMDEVWNMGKCLACQKFLFGSDRKALFLRHLLAVTAHIEQQWPDVRPIIWDDMIRAWPEEALQPIAPHADVMIWGYIDNLAELIPPPVLAKLAAAFPHIWLASSFKGSGGEKISHVPIAHHVNNHLSWLETIQKANSPPNIAGMALTGWSRYSHHRVLCELLPAGIPSLALCAGIMDNRGLNHSLHARLSKRLGFHSLIPIDNDHPMAELSGLTFPGHAVFSLVERRQAARLLKLDARHLEGEQRRQAAQDVFKLLDELVNIAADVLGEVYPRTVVREWIDHKLLGMWTWAKQESSKHI